MDEWPSAPTIGEEFYLEPEDRWYYWDGSRWVGKTTFALPDSLDAAFAEATAAADANGWLLLEMRRLRVGADLATIVWQVVAGLEADPLPAVLPPRHTAQDPDLTAALRALAAKLRGKG